MVGIPHATAQRILCQYYYLLYRPKHFGRAARFPGEALAALVSSIHYIVSDRDSYLDGAACKAHVLPPS
jgi:hypothetical protein